MINRVSSRSPCLFVRCFYWLFVGQKKNTFTEDGSPNIRKPFFLFVNIFGKSEILRFNKGNNMSFFKLKGNNSKLRLILLSLLNRFVQFLDTSLTF